MTQALSGTRVLDLTQVMAGPYCTMVLCDMGADVIKIEPPTGDSTRRMPGRVGTDSPSFNAVNRGKRGVVVDLKQAAGRDTVRRLAGSADVLVENYRPGVLSRFGLGYEELSRLYPALVYASISGYGQTGPSAGKGGFDLVAQGVSGLMSVTGEADGPPAKIGVPITDLGAALFAVTGILAALLARARTGRGQLIDTSLVDAGGRVVRVGGHPVFLWPGRAGAAGLCTSHERALSGGPVRRRLHHGRRRQRPNLSPVV